MNECVVTDVEQAAKAIAKMAEQFDSDISQVALCDAEGEAQSLFLYIRQSPETVKCVQNAIEQFEKEA